MLSFFALLQALLNGCLFFRGQRYEDFVVRTPFAEKDFLILGFMGGRDSWEGKKPSSRTGHELPCHEKSVTSCGNRGKPQARGGRLS